MISRKPARLWLDLETTDLDHMRGSIVEIGCVVADADHNELAAWESVAAPDGDARWSDWCLIHHAASGLIAATAHARQLGAVLCDLDLWLDSALQGEVVPLAGYSPQSFDRPWLTTHIHYLNLPNVLRHCTHRHYDVSTLLADLADVDPDAYAALQAERTPSPHRALADCRHALATARRLRQLRRSR